MKYELKRLAPGGIEAALEKAQTYRALNQPDEAESICRDVLDVAPDHPAALRALGLALTDQFAGGSPALFDEAMATFARLPDPYERAYYAGIAWERSAKAHLDRREARGAMTALEHALGQFALAEKLAHGDAADPVLRWNRCVRLLTLHPSLRDLADTHHERASLLGD